MLSRILGKLFDRFYTVQTASKSTGLGLSIAKQFTNRLDGTIDSGYRNGVLSIRLRFPDTDCLPDISK